MPGAVSASTGVVNPLSDRGPPALIAIFPLMLIYAVGFMSATYLPVWVGATSTRFAVPAATIGLIGSYQLGTVAIATILSAAFRSPGLSRIPLVAALIVSVLFNLLAAVAHSVEFFALALIVSGLANGFLLAEVNGRAAASAVPTRVFSGQLFVMMSCAVLFFATAPRLLDLWGLGAPFLFCAGAGAVALLSLLKLDPYDSKRRSGATRPKFRLQATGVLFLAAPTLLFISMNVIWPFIGPEASRAGVPLTTYAKALSAGALINLLGPILAERLLKIRASWIPVMTLGIIAFLLCAALITAFASAPAFIVGVTFLPFFLLVIVPFYLTFLLQAEMSGKFVAVSSAFFMLGTAIGPGLGGLALGAFGLKGLAFASILTPLLALASTWAGAFKYSRRAA